MSRRDFLKTCTAGALTLIGVGTGSKALASSGTDGDVPGLLIDVSKCIGCRECMKACATTWPLREGDKIVEPPPLNTIDEPTAEVLTYIKDFRYVEGNKEHFGHVKVQCMHCDEPACASACPVAALHKSEEGPVLYDASRCLGCRYCMTACPFQIPAYNWNNLAPQVRKCWLCKVNIEKGDRTACSVSCPTGATVSGIRSELLAEAERRISAAPDKYENHIYGLNEVGGTSVLYISHVPFEEMGFRTDLTDRPLPAYTWQAMSKIPGIVVTLGVLLSGVSFYSSRRTRLENEGNGNQEGV